MSLAQGFAMPAGAAYGRAGPEAADIGGNPPGGNPPGGNPTGIDDSDSDESTDSMASCPLAGPTRYRKSFKSIVRGVFKVHSSELGLDHADFKRRVAELRGGARSKEVDEEAQFLHVICNQYAGAAALESGDVWEKWADMCEFYETGALPRYVSSGPRRKKGKWNFDLAIAEAEREQPYRTRDFLDAHGLGAHDELHERMEAAVMVWARKEGRAEPPLISSHGRVFEEHAFDRADEKHMEALLPAVMKEQLRADAVRRVKPPPTGARQQPAPLRAPAGVPAGVPAAVGAAAAQRFAPSPEDLEEGLDPDEQVSWNMGVLEKMGVYQLVMDHPAQQQILANLNRSLTVEDGVKQIAMKCGSLYMRKPHVFTPQPQMNEEKRRVYKRSMLPSMFRCANEVLEAYVYRFK
jgi:hypothetical protein